MKLVFILSNSKIVGGGEYYMFKLLEYLAKRGNEVIIFTTTKASYTESLSNIKNMTIYYRGKFPKLFKGSGLINRLWYNIYTKIKIEPFIKKEKGIDFIIGYHREDTIKTNKLAKKFDKISVTFVFETPDWMNSQLKDRWREEYKGRFKKSWLLTKEALKTIDVIFPISNLTRRENEKWLNRRIETPIYPGMDRSIVDKVNNIKKENQIIYIGRLNAYKNVDLLIKALSKIHSPPNLVICGDGEEKKKLIDLATKLKVKCNFKLDVSGNEKWIEIKKSLFMVFPTSFEGFGMPPMEALYCRIPCICTDIPILREVYQNKVEYFKDGNINDLVNKINFLLRNPDYCKKRGVEGRKYILSRYSWDKAAKKLEGILKNYNN